MGLVLSAEDSVYQIKLQCKTLLDLIILMSNAQTLLHWIKVQNLDWSIYKYYKDAPCPSQQCVWASVRVLFSGIVCMRSSVCVCVCVCVWLCMCVQLCACVFAMFCMKMFVNFHMFCTLGYLIMGICALYVCFSWNCKALWVSKNSL